MEYGVLCLYCKISCIQPINSTMKFSIHAQAHQGGRALQRQSKPRHLQQPHSLNRPSTSFTDELPRDLNVGIIGGGISGLSCALQLASLGIRSTVFDTGEHGVGGRAATRSTADGSLHNPTARAGTPLMFDHAAQYFTAADERFQQWVDSWVRSGVVVPWRAPVGTLRRGGPFTQLPGAVTPYICPEGMRSLASHMAGTAQQTGLVSIQRPVWVSDMTPNRHHWRLMGKGRRVGDFDAVVIAHNGKCANRLVSTGNVPAVEGQLRRLKLSANWVLMVAFAGPISLPGAAQGAHVDGCPVLAWAGNNSSKSAVQQTTATAGSRVECWTLISTEEYGRQNKVPQEAVPPDVAARVTQELLAAFAALAGQQHVSDLPGVLYSKAQLWGAALPINSPGVPCIWDAQGRVGVCGDWLTGASVQSAVLSGQALAGQIAAQRGAGTSEAPAFSVGLDARFSALKGCNAIGEFPGAPTLVAASRDLRSGHSTTRSGNPATNSATAASRYGSLQKRCDNPSAGQPRERHQHRSHAQSQRGTAQQGRARSLQEAPASQRQGRQQRSELPAQQHARLQAVLGANKPIDRTMGMQHERQSKGSKQGKEAQKKTLDVATGDLIGHSTAQISTRQPSAAQLTSTGAEQESSGTLPSRPAQDVVLHMKPERVTR